MNRIKTWVSRRRLWAVALRGICFLPLLPFLLAGAVAEAALDWLHATLPRPTK